MTKAAEQVLEQALRLDPADRAELIERLDDASPDGSAYADVWDVELRERIADVERGNVTMISWEQVRDHLGQDVHSSEDGSRATG